MSTPTPHDLSPLETLYDATTGTDMPLPPALSTFYGALRFPSHPVGPHIMSNFVSTLDGVVSLSIPGQAGGGEISGFNKHDKMVMGVLRAVSDAVIVGAGTLRSVPAHVWTAEYIYPHLAGAFRELRAALGKDGPPLNVIVTARGDIDLGVRVFSSGEVQSLIITGPEGAARISERDLPPTVSIAVAEGTGPISARWIVETVSHATRGTLFLVEGGPHLLADFFAEGCLDEQFLTLAPQIAGRDKPGERPALVEGKTFAPQQPLWGSLVSAKRAEDHLFLRYSFERSEAKG